MGSFVLFSFLTAQTGITFLVRMALVTVVLVASDGHARAGVSFDAWREAFWADARAFGIRRAVFDAAFRGVKPDLTLPDLDVPTPKSKRPKGQAEFVRPPQAYLNAAYLGRLAAQGRALMRQHKETLAQIERKIGVAPEVVLAIWGRETAFGTYTLPHDAIRSLATQAYMGKRREMFREELLYALKMLQDGVVKRRAFRSSWAGAVGLTQFMPSEYFALAYDLDGDGRRDIWSAPDGLASAANQLKKKGWETGKTWGFEVRLPASVTCAMDGPAGARKIGEWAKLGVRRVAKREFPKSYLDEEAFLLTPGGGHGPAFLVLENFMVFKRYNPSDLYALFVGTLADRILGVPGFVAGWGDIRQLPTRQIAAVQAHLKAGGYQISKVDGKIGANTRSQIGLYETRHHLPVTCWPSKKLLSHMNAKRGAPSSQRTSRP